MSHDSLLSFVAPSAVRLLLAGIANFTIAWRIRGREEFPLEIPFRGVLRGRDLRAAIAKARGEEAAKLLLQQYRARSAAGRALVHVGDGWPYLWSDEKGEVQRAGGKAKEKPEIRDEEELLIPGQLRARIYVHRK